jgi:uncharacterized membrane protein
MSILKYIILSLIGGCTYVGIELLWRGYSHWSMFIVGAAVFLLIGAINEFYTYGMPLWLQCLIAAVIITVVELMAGLIINVWLKWDVWSYKDIPLNLGGQICLLYSCLWYVLSAVGIVLDDVARWLIWGEEKPHYKVL